MPNFSSDLNFPQAYIGIWAPGFWGGGGGGGVASHATFFHMATGDKRNEFIYSPILLVSVIKKQGHAVI
jgi:hypothetical protein